MKQWTKEEFGRVCEQIEQLNNENQPHKPRRQRKPKVVIPFIVREEPEVSYVALTPDYLSQVLRIEREAFPSPWTQKDFNTYMCQPKCHGYISLEGTSATGYILWRVEENVIIDNLAVRRSERRLNRGRALVGLLGGYGLPIQAYVDERNVGAQLFFKKCGFVCVKIIQSHPEVPWTVYVFELLPEGWNQRQPQESKALA